jgi:hypothetical protein
MSNSRDLLKEAIADAKSVKEAAIANAKAALEEAFTPYLQEKFAAKLAEMEMEEEDDMYEEMTDENYGEDLEEKMSNPVMRRGLRGDDAEELETEKMRDKNMEEELDLEELLAELDEEMREKEDMEETLNEAEEEEMEMDSEEEEEGEEGDEEIDLEDMTEEELKDLIEDVIEDMVRAGELEAGEKFEEEDEDEEDIDIDMEDEEEMVAERAYYGKNKGDKPRKSTAKEKGELLKEEEIDENIMSKIKGMSEEMLMKLFGVKTVGELLAALGNAAGAGKKMEEAAEVEEMRSEMEELASTLFEVKLLNAKLLYSNKIFRAKNLTETQKVKVLEAFDKATSVKEAKLIYETLSTVKETKPAINESVRGMASKAAGIAPEKKPILEVNDQFARWQVLAGIKK